MEEARAGDPNTAAVELAAALDPKIRKLYAKII